mmetsp:Transcript_32818/g.54197  ORF Transcript_32818/g.54197 Transcript_32818/m.54197 type:complete len:328 (+) Transcript_32818:62-1045(+)|eukprot:CAMPEP_0119014152 /NCGR_PEP_ID=MMETSP1176-20130426/9381_1 /TAXON_ID=265551 /ORGANISM="Synedropsis recta cf, Strain CCMP1620" /LENGTH=327 /DNA_ID=CAMNT_0006967293 /DNA_START=34 /DNA_END=1017 /DNA_ORIENTATION=-
MKAFSIQTSVLFTALAALGGANGQEYAYLVSNVRQNESWCVTATNGVSSDFGNLGFRPCDFNAAPKNQLWRLDADGMIHSALDDTKCIIVNFGNDVFNGVRVRTTNCDTVSTNLQFTHNGGTDQLRLASNDNYCLTNRGTSPNPSDTIHMKICDTGGRYIFTYRAQGDTPSPAVTPTPAPNDVPPTSIPAELFVNIATDGGCINVRNSNVRNDQKLMLDGCLPNQRWYSAKVDALLTTFSTLLDPSKCMQAGRTATPRKGTKMRIFSCDDTNPLQLFQLFNEDSVSFQLQLGNTNLCVDHRGINANLNADPIILKPCSEAGNFTNIV